MKRFLAGLALGLLVSGTIFLLWHRGSGKTVEPQALLENQRVRMVRWVLQPGESSPVHTHALDHISVIIHGSTLRDVELNGTAKEIAQKTGDATFNPGTGRTHSFANTGRSTFESIAIELK